ncbi:hypothetical protein D9M68_873710 [compost metagenome]
MPRVLHRVSSQTTQTSPRHLQRPINPSEDPAVTWNHMQRRQLLDQIKRRRDVSERRLAHQFREGDAEPVFPQRIRGNQGS